MKNEMRKKIMRNRNIIKTILIVSVLMICVGALLISITERKTINVSVDGKDYPVKLIDRPFIEEGWAIFFVGLYTLTFAWGIRSLYNRRSDIQLWMTNTV